MNDTELRIVVGVDEAGRGALAGPVVAGSVMLGNAVIDGIDDSKRLSAAAREKLNEVIIEECIAYKTALATVAEIEQLNVLEATMIAMQRSVAGIVIVPDLVLVDGNRKPDFPYPSETIVKGDSTVPEIMAASILAKVCRDQIMLELDKEFPVYGFVNHKGYPTAEHIVALKRHGPCPHHRRKFGPVAKLLAERDNG